MQDLLGYGVKRYNARLGFTIPGDFNRFSDNLLMTAMNTVKTANGNDRIPEFPVTFSVYLHKSSELVYTRHHYAGRLP